MILLILEGLPTIFKKLLRTDYVYNHIGTFDNIISATIPWDYLHLLKLVHHSTTNFFLKIK